jgi:chromosome segregation ATPase
MSDETATAEAKDQVTRWVQQGQQILALLPGMLEQNERGRARSAEVEVEIERLRHEVAELRRENQQLRTERDEIAEAFASVNEIATRVRVTPRRSPFERDPRAGAQTAAAPAATTPTN